MSDALEQAKRELDIATSALDASGSSRSYAEMTRAAECAQAAALIAQVERMDTQNEQLLYIRGYLHDLLAVFQTAKGPDDAIKVTQ